MSTFINITNQELWIRKDMIVYIQTHKTKRNIQICLQGELEPVDLKFSTLDEYNQMLQQLIGS